MSKVKDLSLEELNANTFMPTNYPEVIEFTFAVSKYLDNDDDTTYIECVLETGTCCNTTTNNCYYGDTTLTRQ